MIIGAVTAMAREARLVRRSASRSRSTSNVILSPGGIGPEFARAGARSLVERGAELLLSTGYAGGLDPDLKAGDLLVPETIIDEEGVRSATWVEGRDQIHLALTAFGRKRAGTLVSRTKVIASVEEKQAVATVSGAFGVDLESAAVAAVGRESGVPVLVVRSVSDPAHHPLPRAALAATSIQGRTSLPRLLGGLARRPWELPGLLRVARGVSAADRTLESVLVEVLPLLARTQRRMSGEGVQ